MPEKERFFVPSRSYDFQMKIKDLDYTNDLISVKILSSLSTAYQVVMLRLLVDPTDLILKEVFGTDPIKLNIRLLGQTEVSSEEVNFDLMLLKTDFKLTETVQSTSQAQKDRSPVTITTVCSSPFKTMTTLVNDVYTETTVRDVVESLASKIGATLEFDSDKENTENIDQICIPPTTFYKIIKEADYNSPDAFDGFIDKNFGYFEGVPGIFCQHDNTVYIKNLTAKMTKNQTFTIYHLASDADNKEIIEKSIDGENFYTYDAVDNSFSGNARYAALAPTLKYNVNPKDKLYNTITQNLDEVCSKFGLIHQNKTIQTDPTISESTRISYDNSGTGLDSSELLYNSRVARSVADLATLSVGLEKNLPILRLMDVGESVKFNTGISEFVDLSGKYILWSSELNFVKSGDWSSVARINLVRTNKKI